MTNIPHTLAVFGATGGTGRELVTQALAAGHQVRAVVRNPGAVHIEHPNLTVHAADVLQDRDTIEKAITGVDVVISALGSRTGRQPTDIYSLGTRNIGEAMSGAGIRRLLVISALPVSPASEKTLADRLFVHRLLYLFFGGGYHDLRRMEGELMATTDMDWTIFRPPYLADGPATGHSRTAIEAKLSDARSIRRADLAAAMLEAIDDRRVFSKAINIAQ